MKKIVNKRKLTALCGIAIGALLMSTGAYAEFAEATSHWKKQGNAFLDFIVYICAIAGFCVIAIAGWTAYALNNGKANQKQQEAGMTGVMWGGAIGAGLILITVLVGNVAGTFSSGAESQANAALEEILN